MTSSGPIAVVGVGLRYPGGIRSLAGLKELLRSGRDVFQTVPADRWSEALWDPHGTRPGSAVNHVGGFLTDIDRFDAAFFGVSPKEAGFIDPQQRMLMEVAWEAMSNAGVPREGWKGTSCSVHIGMLAGDYGLLHARTLGLAGIGPHYITGTDPSFAAGRLAYVFDLRGPVTTVNAACSSSLVAVHQACQALRAAECDVALAGGASLLIGPDLSVFLSTVGALSPTGRCRPFDAAADGMVRGEGCAVVVLKRLADARADGDRVLAVIRGSAMTHDGASLGMTAPNPASQATMLRTALAAAELEPGDVDYVEAHGTGTQLGDQIELGMLADVYDRGRTSALLVGSVKSVLGHTDAAAGITGLLKAIGVAGEGTVPAQHGFEVPNPAVDWSSGVIAVPTRAIELPEPGRPWRAGVSSFGLSGTNVHVILEAPPPPPAAARRPAPYVVAMSSSHRATLADQVGQMRELVGQVGDDLPDLSISSLTRATVLPHRYAVVAGDRGELTDGLADPLDPPDGAFAGHVPNPDTPPELVFVYSGQGGQWRGMGMDLYDADEDFRACLDECDALIRADTGWSLLDVLRGPDDDLDRSDLVQPALFAVQIAITRWLARRGVTPTAVIGHSMGEVAAGHTAGRLSLSDAVRLIVERARLLHATAGTGVMYAVKAGRAATEELLTRAGDGVTVAAVNGPNSVIIAGAPEPTTAAVAALEAGGIRSRRLRVDTASHSPVVHSCGPLLTAALDGLKPGSPAIPQLSTVDGHAEDARFDAEYWGRNLTRTVNFWPAVDGFLADHDNVVFLEIGPHPVLTTSVMEAVAHRGARSATVATLRRDADGPLALHRTLAELFVNGVDIDWRRVFGPSAQFRTLPVPAWAGERYWLPEAPQPASEPVAEPVRRPATTAHQPPEKPPADQSIALQVEAIVRDVLGIGPDQPLLRRRGLFEQGLDSLGAAELRRRLQDAFGVALAVPVVFEHPTIAALAEQLANNSGAAGRDLRPAPAARNTDDAIAIVGLACRLPGADSPAAFWELLENGRSHVGEPPAGRHDDAIWRESAVPVPSRGCYLDDVAGFDAQFFRISPREARSIDPQQRLILEVAWDALEDSGHPAKTLQGESVGVYVGLEAADYQQLLARNMKNINLYYGTGTSFAAVAGRLSYFLGLTGPSLVVDTACSASLTAVHLACQGLRSGDCDTAVVGGAHVMLAPTLMVAMAESGALAADGYCKTFDENADGYGCGEGAAVVVLKRLGDAQRDNDRVYAVLRGTAINQDGASGGFTVPNGSAQTALIREALRRADWAPRDVDYVEAHGTGTPLGDPIEVNALAAAYGPDRDPDSPLLVGSAKPNVGHLAAAAGVVGLLKVTLSLWHGSIPPHLVDRPTSRIDWDTLPVELPIQARPWPGRSRPARAAVSSFGLTGTNVHVLLEQAVPSTGSSGSERLPVMVLPLSAVSDAALRTAAKQLGAQLRARPEELDGVVATAAFRRSALPVRLAVTAATAQEMIIGLERAVSGGQAHTGRLETEETVAVCFRYGGDLPSPLARGRLSDALPYRLALGECADRLERLSGTPHDLLGEPPAEWRPVFRLCHHIAMTALWQAYGVVAPSVCGSAAAAAWAGGRCTFEEAVGMLREHGDGADEQTSVDGGTPTVIVELTTTADATDPLAEVAEAVAELFVRGGELTPPGGFTVAPVSLPGYPWQHQQFWYRETTRNGRGQEVVRNGGSSSGKQVERLGQLVKQRWTARPDNSATSI